MSFLPAKKGEVNKFPYTFDYFKTGKMFQNYLINELLWLH